MWPVAGSDCVFYYRNLDAAVSFYTDQLGLSVVMGRERGDGLPRGIGVHLQLASTSFLTLVDGTSPHSNHSATEPKATALALLTDDLEAWDAHAAERGLEFRNGKRLDRNPAGSAHDGFVILDPEGYKVRRCGNLAPSPASLWHSLNTRTRVQLEFEQFLPHPENDELLPALAQLPNHLTALPGPPKRLKASINWLYYRDAAAARAFHTTTLGLSLVCVQPGVADIYQTSASGFFGAVDERAGMSDWAQPAAVMLSFCVHDVHLAHAALVSAVQEASQRNGSQPLQFQVDETVDKSDPRFDAFVATDIECYSIEWFQLKPTSVTATHIAALKAGRRVALTLGDARL